MVRILKALSAIALASSMGLGISSALAAGDVAKGAHLYETHICSSCHATVKGFASPIGPNLFGVVGRKAGSLAGFSYSPAMKASGIIWDEGALTKYLMSPLTVVPGSKIVLKGFMKQEEAESVAAYLASLK